MKKRVICLLWTVVCALSLMAQSYKTVSDIAYTAKTDDYSASRLKLVGHESTYFYEFDGHVGMVDPGYHILEWWVKKMYNQPFEP